MRRGMRVIQPRGGAGKVDFCEKMSMDVAHNEYI